MIGHIWQDVRFASRVLRKNLGFTVVAILTLALGIGANTAIFSVISAVLLHPLPYSEPDRLISVWGYDTKAGDDHTYLSYDDFNDYRNSTESFEFFAGFTPQWSSTVTGSGDAERLTGFFASADFFPGLGVQPVLGRVFTDAEDKRGGTPVILLSYALWQTRFGGDPNILDRQITLDGENLNIIGVLPASFRWLEPGDFWQPLAHNSVLSRGRAVRLVSFVGRLKPGVSRESAQAELATIADRLTEAYPASNTGIGVNAVALYDEVTGRVRPVLIALLGAVALVLLIACVNVANLVLARSRARAREMAVRVSLGARRSRLVGQLLTESVVLSLMAGAAGILLALWGVDLLVSLSPVDVPRKNEIGLSQPVLLFTMVLSVITGLVFGILPALQVSRTDLSEALKEGSRGTAGPGRHRTLKVLVIAEVALSLVVVTASGLLLRSFSKLQSVDPGFNTESVLSFDLPTPPRYQDTNKRAAFYQQLYSHIEALPGVLAVGDVTRLPLAGRAGNPTTVMAVEGVPSAPGDRPQIDFRRAGWNYFKAMGIPLVAGRVFDERDKPDTELVSVINQTAAQRLFPGEDPIGKRIGFGNAATPQWNRIVGIVGNVRHLGLQVEPRPEVYISASQAPPFAPVVVVRGSVETTTLVAAIRAVIRDLDPDVPIFNVLTLQQIRYQSLNQPRFQVFLFGLFGVAALLLALVGVYGVMAYSVSQRAHEVGIRLALGARREDVLRLVLGEGMKLTAVGVAIGIPLALAATRLMSRLLFETAPSDALTYSGVAVLLVATALLACFMPARRAARVDPMVALRQE